MIAIILAGGVGKRLWPLGRRKTPKQFHSLTSKISLIRESYLRIARGSQKIPNKKIFISTSPEFVKIIKKHIPEIPQSQFIIEPKRFDTAFGMGFAAQKLQALGFGNEPCVFLPADHYISTGEQFRNTISVIEKMLKEALAKKQDLLVDIAVPPTFPSTALGYTKIGKKIKTIDGVEVFEFKGHTEKPDSKTATKYLRTKNYLWHANYYSATPNHFLKLLKKYCPKITKPISFDYAVTEKMDPHQVKILKAPFAWSDIGTWDEVWARTIAKDNNGNVVEGQALLKDSNDSLVISRGKRMVVGLGLKDIYIIDTPDALFVLSKKSAQHSKKIVEELEGLDKWTIL